MTTYASTINPAIPASGSPLASSPIRANFAAAQADVNALAALIAQGGGTGGPTPTIQVITNSYSVTVLSTDNYIEIANATAGATGVSLPAVPATGQVVAVKDAGYNCTSFPITITALAGLIDNATSYVMNYKDGESITVKWNGQNWRVI